MKNALLTTITVSALLISALAVALQVDFGTANPMGFIFPHEPHTVIRVLSPENLTHFSAKSISLTFSLNLSLWYPDYLSEYNPSYSCSVSPIQYYLDGEPAGEIQENVTGKFSSFSVILDGLADGVHSLEVNVTTTGIHWIKVGGFGPNDIPAWNDSGAPVLDSSGVFYFSVYAPPNFSNLSIESKSYNSTEIPLSFNIDEPASQISYSLDNKANATITGNTTLSGLSEGSHSLIVYANDTVGNTGKSDTVFFTVNTQPSPTPSPTQSSSPTQQLPSSSNDVSSLGLRAGPSPAWQFIITTITVAVIAAIIVTAFIVIRKINDRRRIARLPPRRSLG